MSRGTTPIVDLFNAFSYPLLKTGLAQSLASQFSTHDIHCSSLGENILMAGSLLAVGRINDYTSLIEQTNFTSLSYNDRVTFTAALFRSFHKQLFPPPGNAICAEALHCIVQNLLPDLMNPLASTCEGFSPSPSLSGLIQLPYASRIRPDVKGAVFFRQFTMGPDSRQHEFGLRIQKNLASQGWDVSLHSPVSLQSVFPSGMFDFALIDVGLLNALNSSEVSVIEEVKRIRRNFRKVIVVEPDPWCAEHIPLLNEVMEHIDFVWGLTTDWPFLYQHSCTGKAILFPNVGGFDDMATEREAMEDWGRCTFSFVGSIGIPNLTRVYWALESLHHKLPISFVITDPCNDDGMDQETSLKSYARLLAASHSGVNFAKRLDGSRMLTGRTLEIISLKRLLLQETCPAMKSYFVEGEHFLEFSNIEELSTAVEFIRSHPKTAQMIAREGYEYYLQHYSGRKLVEHFQVLLDS